MVDDEGSKISRFSAESAVRYLDKSAESSDEFEFIEEDDVAKGKKTQNFDLHSSLRKQKCH